MLFGINARPKEKSHDNWRKPNRKVVGMIKLWIEHNTCHHVVIEINAHELLEKLANLFECKTTQNKVFLSSKLVDMKYKDAF